MQPYTISEAKSAFVRMLRHHEANGWGAAAAAAPLQEQSEPSRLARPRSPWPRSVPAGSTAVPANQAEADSSSQQSCVRGRTTMLMAYMTSLPLAADLDNTTIGGQQETTLGKKRNASQAGALFNPELPGGKLSSVLSAAETSAACGAQALQLDTPKVCRTAASAAATSLSPVDPTLCTVTKPDSPQMQAKKATNAAPACGQQNPDETLDVPAGGSDAQGVVDLLSPVAQTATDTFCGTDLVPEANAKRRKLSSEVLHMQVGSCCCFVFT